MLHLESTSGTVKGAGRIRQFLENLYIGVESKASNLKSNALFAFGAAAGLPPGIGSVGDDANIDLSLVPKGTGAIVSAQTQAAAVQGGVGSCVELPPKTVTAIADNTATTVLTITIPNGAHAALIELQILASLGAGGAIGAFEESLTAYGQIVVTRTAGVNAVATAIALTNTGKANVAGADSTATLAYSLAAVSGAVGATNTIAIQVTIAKGGGSSAAHQAIVIPVVTNANASGITVA